MKFILVLIICSLYFLNGISQNKRDYHWFFGSGDKELEIPGIQSYKFDFNKKPFIVEKTDIAYPFTHMNASICDKEGNLLFYSNGCAVINAKHQVMPNGDSINAGLFFDVLWHGDCNFGYPGTQNIIILTDPENEDGYFVLHKARIYIQGESPSIPREIQYSYVDMSLDNENGDVVVKNQVFTPYQPLLSSYLTAMQHNNEEDWWIIQPMQDSNLFWTFLLDKNGFHKKDNQPIGYEVNADWSSAGGTAKFSPDGTKYAMYNYYHQLHVYDFDRTTGTLSNHKMVAVLPPYEEEIRFCSVEWSPNSRFIYTASHLELHQIDTWESNMEDGVVLIDTYDGTQNPFVNSFFLMAQGPDCRIYICSTSGNWTYHVINHPDEKGLDCDFDQNGIELPYSAGFGSMPNHPRWRVDEEEKCDPTIVSVFGVPVYTRKDLEVYPNPSNLGHVNVRIPENKSGTIELIDFNGRMIQKIDVDRGTLEIKVDLPASSALYYLEFVPDDNMWKMIYTAKVEVVH